MSLIQRIGATPETYALELTIHSITINIPFPVKLKVVIKRGKKHKEETSAIDHDVSLGTAFFDHATLFKVTMFKKNKLYLKKVAYIRLIQISKRKSVKNGKGKLDISRIIALNTSFERKDIKLKNCSDRNATICVSAVLTRIDRTSSMGSLSTESLSFDEADFSQFTNTTFAITNEIETFHDTKKILSSSVVYEDNKKKKLEAKEKFRRRLEKLNTIAKEKTTKEPNSAYPFHEIESNSPSPTISPKPRRPEKLFTYASNLDSKQELFIAFETDEIKEN